MKDTFLHNEIWLLTTRGGFQRANLYDKKVNVNEVERKKFRDSLHQQIKDISLSNYTKKINEDRHIDNIRNIINHTEKSKYSYLLNGGKLNFGISQKLLNLYLKYLWCVNKIHIPPHFPVDRIIQVNLNKEAKELELKQRAITSWTRIEDEVEYVSIINYAKSILNKTKYTSLAELELYLFSRN